MLYYSEITNQFYKTEEDLAKDEAKHELAKEEADKQNKKFKKLLDACNNINKIRRKAAEVIAKAELEYDDLKDEFINIYGIEKYNELVEKEDNLYFDNKYYTLNSTNSTYPELIKEFTSTEDIKSKPNLTIEFDGGPNISVNELIDRMVDYLSNDWKNK